MKPPYSTQFGLEESELKQLVTQVKEQFYEEYELEQENYDRGHVDLFLEKSEYKFVERYLIRRDFKVDKTVGMLRKALKSLKKANFSPLLDEEFPEIFYQLGLYYWTPPDVDGDEVLHITFRMDKAVHKLASEAFDHFMMHALLKTGAKAAERNGRFTICVDCSQFGLRDVDFMKYIRWTKSYLKYCPWGLKHSLLYKLDGSMRHVLKLFLRILPVWMQELIVVVEDNDLTRYIPPEHLPKQLGGLMKEDPRQKLSGCVAFEEYFQTKFGLESHDMEQVHRKLETAIDENWADFNE